ncbi:hypothetical protein [Amycolatopsis sp. cmx-4-68]
MTTRDLFRRSAAHNPSFFSVAGAMNQFRPTPPIELVSPAREPERSIS